MQNKPFPTKFEARADPPVSDGEVNNYYFSSLTPPSDHVPTATGPVSCSPVRSFGRSLTSHDQSLTVLSVRRSKRTGTVTETGPVWTTVAVRSVAVQSRSKTGLQTVFGPDPWTLCGGRHRKGHHSGSHCGTPCEAHIRPPSPVCPPAVQGGCLSPAGIWPPGMVHAHM